MKGCVKFRENTQIWVGHNSRTTRPIELKFSESSFLAKITLETKFHQNRRGSGVKLHYFWVIWCGMTLSWTPKKFLQFLLI